MLKFKNAGLVLFACVLQRRYRADYGRIYLNDRDDYPILTLGGTMDGLFKPSRVVEARFQSHLNVAYLGNVTSYEDLVLQRPVLLLDGASHMSFASGRPRFLVAANDLRSLIPEWEAHNQISNAIANWMVHTLLSGTYDAHSSRHELLRIQDVAARVMQPMIDALLLEGSHHFKPACNELKAGDKRLYRDPSADESLSRCWLGSPWSQLMQQELVKLPQEHQLPKGTQVQSHDAFWKVYLVNPVHLPSVSNSTCQSGDACQVDVGTVTQATYQKIDFVDLGFKKGSAVTELRTKFASIQSVHVAAGVAGAGDDSYFASVDDNDQICK